MKKIIDTLFDSAGRLAEKAENLSGSAKSSRASLGAAHEAYVVLEAERKGPEAEKALYNEAADERRRTTGCSVDKALADVVHEAGFLKASCAGNSTFRAAKERLDAKEKAAQGKGTMGPQPDLGDPVPAG